MDAAGVQFLLLAVCGERHSDAAEVLGEQDDQPGSHGRDTPVAAGIGASRVKQRQADERDGGRDGERADEAHEEANEAGETHHDLEEGAHHDGTLQCSHSALPHFDEDWRGGVDQAGVLCPGWTCPLWHRQHSHGRCQQCKCTTLENRQPDPEEDLEQRADPRDKEDGADEVTLGQAVMLQAQPLGQNQGYGDDTPERCQAMLNAKDDTQIPGRNIRHTVG